MNRKCKKILLFIFMIVCFNLNIVLADSEILETQDTTLNWAQFLGNEQLQGVSDAKTPRTSEELVEKWRYAEKGGWEVTPGTPIVIGEYTYCYVNEKIIKFNTQTGKVEATGDAPGSAMFFIYASYGDGKIFVPRKNLSDKVSNIIAYDANTLEQLYVTENIKSGADLQTPIMYHDGYVYMGTYGGKGVYAAYPTKDVDLDKKDEIVSPAWTINSEATLGFKWNGATFVGNSCIFADGGKKRRNGSTIYSLNAKTGEEIDRYEISEVAEVASSVIYYEKNNRIYFSATEKNHATVRSMEINEDGTFNKDTLKIFKSKIEGGGTQSTPVIYNDRLYLGGGGGTMGSAEPFHVIDANTLEDIYTIEGLLTKGSAAITTAYATKENNNEVYIYMVPYAPKNDKSNLYIIKDCQGQTEAEYELVTGVGDAQYCSQSIDIDKNGNMIFYNDAKVLYCFGNKGDSTIRGKDVFNQIDRLPDINEFKYYNPFEISRIFERYTNLQEDEKIYVTNIQKLKDIKNIANEDPISRLNDGISSIPDVSNITLEEWEKIELLLNIYNNLSEDEKNAVINYEKLIECYEKFLELQHKEKVNEIIRSIDEIPTISNLTSSHKGVIDSIYARIDNLSEKFAANITNINRLEEAKVRVEEIIVKMDEVQKLIEEKLGNEKITLDSRGLILEIDKGAKDIPLSDLVKLTNYEYYLSPAKANITNLLIEEYIHNKDIEVKEENIENVKKIVEEIEYYYLGVLESDKKYIKNYAECEKLRESLDNFLLAHKEEENKENNEGSNSGESKNEKDDKVKIEDDNKINDLNANKDEKIKKLSDENKDEIKTHNDSESSKYDQGRDIEDNKILEKDDTVNTNDNLPRTGGKGIRGIYVLALLLIGSGLYLGIKIKRV